MIYLLSTQALLDILTGKEPMTGWLNSAPRSSVELSTVSIGQAERQIAALANTAQRAALSRALRRFEATLEPHGGIVPFDSEAARTWARLVDADLTYRTVGPDGASSDGPLGLAARMVVASALARGGTLVEAPQPYHGQIGGLSVEHP